MNSPHLVVFLRTTQSVRFVCKKNNFNVPFHFLYSELNKLLKPDKQRANELRREFQKGFVGIAKRIWPHLTYVHGVVSGKKIFKMEYVLYVHQSCFYSSALEWKFSTDAHPVT